MSGPKDSSEGREHHDLSTADEQTIFCACIELEGSQREAYLARACSGDERLRQRLERLLDAHSRRLAEIPSETLITASPPDPKVIGNYRILEKIGDGGMASVYLAEQRRPVHRRVALKIIKLGLDSREAIARFESGARIRRL